LLQNVKAGLRDGKLELLRYLTDFEDMQKQSGEQLDFVQWINQTKANYEKVTTTF